MHHLRTQRVVFQQIIECLELVAMHRQSTWQPTFVHGIHATRIDFMFVRQSQIRRNTMIPHLNNIFERTFGDQGPYYHPLGLYLPRWHPKPSPRQTPDPIDRFRLRQV